MNLGENLKKLIDRHNLNTLELSRRTGIGQPVIYRIMTGETDNPKIITVCALADYFKVPVNQLVNGDIDQVLNEPNHALFSVPLLAWEQASSWPHLSTSERERAEKISVHLDPNPHLYALQLDDGSMEPLFKKGAILVIDGNRKPKDHSYVVVTLKKEKKGIFRQLLICDHLQYLKPVSPNTDQFKINLFDPKVDRCHGVLVQTIMDFS